MTARFRDSGLSHLTAVSGQNVALALAIAGPLLRRARPMVRLVATLAVIGWFVVLTRAEPSVLRAGTMAALAALAFAVGSEREPPRLLACAVVILLADRPVARPLGRLLAVGRGHRRRDDPRSAVAQATRSARAVGDSGGDVDRCAARRAPPERAGVRTGGGDRRRRQPRRRAGGRGGDAVRAPGEHRRRSGSGAARRVDAAGRVWERGGSTRSPPWRPRSNGGHRGTSWCRPSSCVGTRSRSCAGGGGRDERPATMTPR